MPKEKSHNPVQAQHKADKRAQLKKSKAQTQQQRTERLARRNPDRLQKQISELRDLESAGQLRPKDKSTLEQLERDLKAVKRARDNLGTGSEQQDRRRNLAVGGRGRGDDRGGNGQALGKRRRGDGGGGADRNTDDETTDDEVRSIPMPRDTPPPVPRRGTRQRGGQGHTGAAAAANEDKEPQPAAAAAAAQTTYSSAPVLRNLAQEARRFVPAAVAANISRKKGEGGRLLEPEELDRLEKAGYGDAKKAADEGEKEAGYRMMAAEAGGGGDDAALLGREETEWLKSSGMEDAKKIANEMEREAEFEVMADQAESGGKMDVGKDTEKRLRGVEMEEVVDEDL